MLSKFRKRQRVGLYIVWIIFRQTFPTFSTFQFFLSEFKKLYPFVRIFLFQRFNFCLEKKLSSEKIMNMKVVVYHGFIYEISFLLIPEEFTSWTFWKWFFNTKFWWKDHSLIFLSFALYSTIWERWLLVKRILFKSYSGEINFESHCFSFYSTSLNLYGPNKIFFDISFTSFEFKKVAQYF